MRRLKRKKTNNGIIPNISVIPEGTYISIVTDVFTAEIVPVSKGKDLVHVIKHSMISLQDYKYYDFFETISPYKNTPRTEAFIETLKSYDMEFFPDDELVGLVEKIRIVYDFINGCAVPVISERKRMSTDNVEDLDDKDLPF